MLLQVNMHSLRDISKNCFDCSVLSISLSKYLYLKSRFYTSCLTYYLNLAGVLTNIFCNINNLLIQYRGWVGEVSVRLFHLR